jgi:hypothetical protein
MKHSEGMGPNDIDSTCNERIAILVVGVQKPTVIGVFLQWPAQALTVPHQMKAVQSLMEQLPSGTLSLPLSAVGACVYDINGIN